MDTKRYHDTKPRFFVRGGGCNELTGEHFQVPPYSSYPPFDNSPPEAWKSFYESHHEIKLGFLWIPHPHQQPLPGQQPGQRLDPGWYLFVRNHLPPIGYFPADLFKGTGLHGHADGVAFGGLTWSPDQTLLPPLGTGSPAKSGWHDAAHHRDIGYWLEGGPTACTNLKCDPTNRSPEYTIKSGDNDPKWRTYILFGGPLLDMVG